MPTSSLPVYAQNAKTATAVVTGAAGNIAADNPTGTAFLFQAGPNGAQLTRLTATARVTATANAAMMFLADAGANPPVNNVNPGTIQRLVDTVLMPSVTVSASTANAPAPFPNYSDSRAGRLAPYDRVYVGIGGAGNVVFKAEYMDF